MPGKERAKNSRLRLGGQAFKLLLAEGERAAREMLSRAGVDSPGLCARLMAAHVAGLDKLGCALGGERPLSAAEAAALARMAARRARGEPLAYILGKKEFYEHEFQVNAATLVPRPETELVVELALKLLPESAIRFADIGCGCGCIGLSLLARRPLWRGFLLDNSAPALRVAEANSKRIAANAALLRADMFSLPFAKCSLELIVGNPPYIGQGEEALVMPEVLAYEPAAALFSGRDGLGHIEAVIRQAKRVLASGGYLVLEHGAGQRRGIMEMLQAAGFAHIEDHVDLAGLPRCCVARKDNGAA